MKSLEWACAKDRVGRKLKHAEKKTLTEVEEESLEVPELDLNALPSKDTDVEDELATPESSFTMSMINVRENSPSLELKGASPRSEDVEAAMALLGFKVNHP